LETGEFLETESPKIERLGLSIESLGTRFPIISWQDSPGLVWLKVWELSSSTIPWRVNTLQEIDTRLGTGE